MQPYFMPYLGYFQLIASVDHFVFFDNVNFIKRKWINRNYIASNNVRQLLTVPCEEISQNRMIKDILLHDRNKNIPKVVRTIQHAYSKCPYYNTLYTDIERIITSKDNNSISSLNIELIKMFSRYMGLETTFSMSSSMESKTDDVDRKMRLINICRQHEADTYINMTGGRSLYDKESFAENDICLKFLEPGFQHLEVGNIDFSPALSILDVVMKLDPMDIKKLIESYTLD